jgi:hypothetical protein
MGTVILTQFTLLVPTFSLPFAPPLLPVWLLRSGTLAYYSMSAVADTKSVASVDSLSPVIFSAQDH